MTHPIRTAAATMRDALKDVADINPTFMSTSDKAQSLRELAVIEAQMNELRLRVMAASTDVADEAGSRDIASWCAAETRNSRSDVRREARLATALDTGHLQLAVALRQGAINVAQTHVIVRACDALPDEVGADVVAEAEAHLIDQAAHFGPRELARLGRHILEVVAPEIAEEAEARRLAELEADARPKTRLNLRRQGDGTTRISGLLPDAAATRLATYLESFTNPRLATSDDAYDRAAGKDPLTRTAYPHRLGEAFCQFLEAVDPSRLPLHGGDATTVMVTIGLDSLRAELGVGTLATNVPGDDLTGDTLSAHEVRRLACNARIIPAVLGGRSEVLDLGRRQRLFTAAQRRALLVRDQSCRAHGCDIPGTWTEAHHWLPWSTGGPTDLDNAVLLCSHHHHRAHDPAFSAELHANGDVRFSRRT